jgi:serine/threonine-protein kinase RsbW
VTARARITFAVDDLAMSEVETFVAAFFAQHGLCSDDRSRTLIVLEELLTNLLKYGYDARGVRGLAELGLALEPSPRLVVELIDDGRPFDPFAQRAPDLSLPLEDRSCGGLGIHIIRALTEGTAYRRVNDRNLTRLILRVELSDTP